MHGGGEDGIAGGDEENADVTEQTGKDVEGMVDTWERGREGGEREGGRVRGREGGTEQLHI